LTAPLPGATVQNSVLRDPSFVTALVIAIIVALGFGLVVPVLPLFAANFGVSVFAATFVVSAFAGVRLVSNLGAGQIADRIGARRAVGFGALVVAGSSLLAAASPGYWWLVAFRGVGGFGSALFFTALLSLVVRLVPPDQRGRAVGLLQGAFLFGLTVGPVVGGLLAEPLGLRWPFAIYAVFCGAAGGVALAFLPPVPAEGGPPRQGWRQMWTAAQVVCADRAFVAALVMMAATRWSATGVRFSLIPLFGSDVVGAGPGIIGLGLGIAAVSQLAVLWPVGKASDLYGRRAVGAPAYALFAVTAAALGLVTGVTSFLVVLGLYGAATGLTSVIPPAIVADLVPPERTGVGVGVLNTAGDLGSVLGPLVSGLLVDRAGYGWGFSAAAVFLLVGAGFALRMRETSPAVAAA